MGRGPKKHLKRLSAPSHWMLSKMGGTWAPRPSQGPHKLRECLPLLLLLRNRLKYALDRREVMMILQNREVAVDGKVRTDTTYPAGFMDVVSIESTGEAFRLLYDIKGRFKPVPIDKKEANYKLCSVRRAQLGPKGIPYIALHDSRTIRYPDPSIKVGDTVKVDINTGKVVDTIPFTPGNLCMITGGRNVGRVGVYQHTEKHIGGFEIIHLKDVLGHEFATRLSNVFVIGKGKNAAIKLPKQKGVFKNIQEEREERLSKRK